MEQEGWMSDNVYRFLKRLKAKKAEATFRKRKSDLKHFAGWAAEQGYGDLTQLTPLDIDDYLIHQLEGGYADKTVADRYTSVSQFYQAAADKYDLLEEPPTENVDLSEFKGLTDKEPKKAQVLREDVVYITPEEKEALCENVPNPTLRNELIVRLLWQTGVRKHEAADIRLEDINRDERSIQIRSQKTSSNRTVFYQPSLDILLDQWIDGGYRSAHSTSDSPYLFITYRSEKLRWNVVNDVVREAAHDAGIQEKLYEDASGNPRWKITAHTMRHSFAVQSLKNGMDIRFLSKVMGHENLETTKKYLRVTDDDTREMVRRYGAGTEELE